MADYCYSCMEPGIGEGFCPQCGKRNRDITVQAHQLQPGTQLQNGRYLTGRVLGQGGFGITYLGYDTRLNRKVAIKEYFPVEWSNRIATVTSVVTISSAEDAWAIDGLKRFLEEAQLLSRFESVPGVVTVWDFFEENNTAYIIMQYLDGKDLGKLLKERSMTAEETFALFTPIFDVLEQIHSASVIHRDISPDNLMLQQDGSLVLTDFGAARQVSQERSRSLSVMLKPGYAPYEQYTSRGNVGPWTDIYALCATIYKCITGVTPLSAADRMTKDTLRWPSELGIAITPLQEQVLKKGMAIRREDRYQSVSELKRALSGSDPVMTGWCDATLSSNMSNPPVMQKPEQHAAPMPAAAEKTSSAQKSGRSNGMMLGAIAACLLVVIIAAALIGLVLQNYRDNGDDRGGALLGASSEERSAAAADDSNAATDGEETEAVATPEAVATESPAETLTVSGTDSELQYTTMYVCGCDYGYKLWKDENFTEAYPDLIPLGAQADMIEAVNKTHARIRYQGNFGYFSLSKLSDTPPSIDETPKYDLYATGSVSVREGPSTDYAATYTLKAGEVVGYICDMTESWDIDYCKVSYNGYIGYVKKSELSETDPTTQTVAAPSTETYTPPTIIIMQGENQASGSSSSTDSAQQSTDGSSGAGSAGSQTTAENTSDTENVSIMSITASLTLPNEPNFSYIPENACDGNADTSWVEGADGDGIDEYLEMTVDAGTVITGITIKPGYCIDERRFFNNGCPEILELSAGDTSVTIDLTDYASNWSACNAGITISFDKPITSDGTIRLTIKQVRTGTKYQDTCISDIVLLS